MAESRALPNLASFFLSGMTRWLSSDWLAVHGHWVLVAETFWDPMPFAARAHRAIRRRDFHAAPRQAVLGDCLRLNLELGGRIRPGHRTDRR